MVHADPADFDDVATFCTMRLFERAENPERYWFPVEKFVDRVRCGAHDEAKQVLRDYATEKLFLSEEKAEQFRLQFYFLYNNYFGLCRERCSYNLVRFMAIVRQIWETKAVEALADVLDHFRDKVNQKSLTVEIASAFDRQQCDHGGDPRAILASASNDLDNILVTHEMMDQSVGDGAHSADELQGTKSATRLSLQKNAKKMKEFIGRKEICLSAGQLSLFHNLMNAVNQFAYESAKIDICADAVEFVVHHVAAVSVAAVSEVELAAAIQLTPMYPDHIATTCNLELIATICVCLHCAVAAALNGKSGDYRVGFDPPSCMAKGTFARLFCGPASPEYRIDKCATCSHAKTVHYNSVQVLGCGSCHACRRHSTELWDLVDQVARLELPSPVKYPSHAYVLTPPPENITWTAMPLLNRKIILAQSLGPVGSTLYPRLCDELLSTIHFASAQLATAQDALTMDSRPNILHQEVNDSSTIGAPVPRLFIHLLKNGFFANAFHIIQSEYLELKKSDVATIWRWLNLKRLYFSDQRALFTSVEVVPSVSNIIINDMDEAYTHFPIRAGQTRIYLVDKTVLGRFVTEILDFVEFIEQSTRANHLARVTPEVDLNLASSDFSTIQGAEALSIVQFRKGDKLGAGKFGEVYEVTAGSLRMALKVIDLNHKSCSSSLSESYPGFLEPLSSWIDVSNNYMYLLMPRYTTNLCDYIESKKANLTSEGNFFKIALYRVIAASVASNLLSELARWHGGEFKIYHGDIHARNVFLSLDEDHTIAVATLGDFGLVNIEETEPTETTTTDESCPNPSGPVMFNGFSSTFEGNDLANLRSNVIRYMLEDVKKQLSVEELRVGWPKRDQGIEFTAVEMRKANDEALKRTLWELCLIHVFLPQENAQVPHFVCPDFEELRRKLCEMFPPPLRTESVWDQVKACLEASKQVDLDGLLKTMNEIYKSSLSQQLSGHQNHMQQLLALLKSVAVEEAPAAQRESSLSQQLSDIQDLMQLSLTLSKSVEVPTAQNKLALSQHLNEYLQDHMQQLTTLSESSEEDPEPLRTITKPT